MNKETRMKEHYFDDMKVGDRFKSEPLNVTEKQVIEFAHKFDPQMFHLNRKTAERTLFKGLIASGWHTAAMTMRLFVMAAVCQPLAINPLKSVRSAVFKGLIASGWHTAAMTMRLFVQTLNFAEGAIGEV